MYQKPAAPLSIGGVVEDAARLYRASFNRAWVPALILQILLTGALFLVRVQSPELFDAQGMVLALDKVDPSLMAFYMVAFIVSLIFSNAITAQLLAVRNGQELSIGGSLATGFRFFLPTLGMAFLLSPIGLVGTLVAGAPVPELLRTALAALYVLAAIYVMGRVFLAGIALLGDRTGVVGGVRASWRLTRHHWWRTACIMSTVFLIFVLALFVLSLSAGVLNLVVRSGTLTGMLAVQLVSAVIQAATVPFFNAGFVSTYYDLKVRAGSASSAMVTGIR